MNIIKKIQTVLKENNLDAMYIGSPHNRRYITGFTGTFGVALITHTDAFFITDFRYIEQAKKQATAYNVIENRHFIQEIRALSKKLQLNKIGFESEHTSYQEYTQLIEIKNISEWIPLTHVVENIRKIKTPKEIEIIRNAAKIADIAFSNILNDLRPGVTEMEINHQLEFYMRQAGATSSGFDIIVASGHRSSLPHGVASQKIIDSGDMVTLDFGALYEGYRSDITRTVSIGEPSEKMKEIYSIVKEALNIGIASIRSGVSCQQIDKIVRDVITERGYGEYFGHGTGHSFGLEIHESPYFSQTSEETLQSGMVMTVEPGIYLPHQGGVRIEDDILVRGDGAEVLTNSPRELIIL